MINETIGIILLTLLLLILSYIFLKYFNKILKDNNKKNNHNNNYILIDNYNEFKKFENKLLSSKILGIDTEYFHGNSYKGQLCLIQIFSEYFNFSIILDIISLKQNNNKDYNLIKNILEKILNSNEIEKIFHSCFNDIEWIYEEFNIKTKNIFDTQEMHQYLIGRKLNSYNKKSLLDLLKIYLNIFFNLENKKKYQKSNWFNRPLSKEQLIYAANDSIYLIKLRNEIIKKFNEKKINYVKIKENIENIIFQNVYNNNNNSKEKTDKFFVDNQIKYELEDNYNNFIKEIFYDLTKKTDDYCKINNLNKEKILNFGIIYSLCLKLPKSKEEFYNILKEKYSINEHKNFYEEIYIFLSNKISLLNSKKLLNNNNNNNNNINNNNKNKIILNDLKKKLKKNLLSQKFSVKKPIYENCKMLSPNNEQLCFCDTKKMNWYLDRKLAILISSDPPIFKLTFEPNKIGCTDEQGNSSNFYISQRKNCCVICGKENNCMRFHIIPILYRQFFPENLKSHKSHDVVLLCFECHENANKLYEKKINEISVKNNVPLIVLSDNSKKFSILIELNKKCKGLIKNFNNESGKEKIQKKIFESLNEIKNNEKIFEDFINYLKSNEININNYNEIDIKIAECISKYKINSISNRDKKNIHGQLVLEKLNALNNINELKNFIREWRQFFLDSFKPKFLPTEWSVNHEMIRTFGQLSQFKNTNS